MQRTTLRQRLWPATLAAMWALAGAGCAAAPPATPGPGDMAAAFLAVTQRADRTVHMDWTAKLDADPRAGTTTASLSATFDVVGEDYAGTVTTSGSTSDKPLGEVTVERALVAGEGFQRQAGSRTWQSLGAIGARVDPLRGLGQADVEYVGSETRAGRQAHHLRVKSLAALIDILDAALNGGAISPMGDGLDEDSSSFDVWVDANGQPFEATAIVQPSPSAVTFGGYTINASYEFSNWNAEIYIVAPVNAGELPPPPAKP